MVTNVNSVWGGKLMPWTCCGSSPVWPNLWWDESFMCFHPNGIQFKLPRPLVTSLMTLTKEEWRVCPTLEATCVVYGVVDDQVVGRTQKRCCCSYQQLWRIIVLSIKRSRHGTSEFWTIIKWHISRWNCTKSVLTTLRPAGGGGGGGWNIFDSFSNGPFYCKNQV